MLKTVSTGMMAKSIIDEIGGASHGQEWNFEYFDHKFQLKGANMNLVSNNLNAITEYIETIDAKISRNKINTIVTSCVAFLIIAGLIIGTAMLMRRTQTSHFQKRMNNVMRAVTQMRDEYRQKLRLARAREELDRMDTNEHEIERGIDAVHNFE